MARVVPASRLVAAFGPRWFNLGRSRKDATTHEVRLADPKWRRVPLVDGNRYLGCAVWNGAPDDESAKLDVTVFDPPEQPDALVVSAPLTVVRARLGWDDLVADARDLARDLGGCTVIGSTDLEDDADDLAVVWGVDRSSANPLFTAPAPPDRIACASWDDVARYSSGSS